jgi:hypothetical protein
MEDLSGKKIKKVIEKTDKAIESKKVAEKIDKKIKKGPDVDMGASW